MKLNLLIVYVMAAGIAPDEIMNIVGHDSSQLSVQSASDGLMAKIMSYFTPADEKYLSPEQLIIVKAKKTAIQTVFNV